MARVARARVRRQLAWAGYFVLLAGAGTVGLHFGWEDRAGFRQPTLTPEASSRAPAPRVAAPRSGTDEAEARALGELAPAAGSPPPSFDIVRVSPDGGAVLAGRAPVGSSVTVLDGGRPLTRVAARGGEWAVVLDRPLAPGARDLSVEATLPDGEKIAGQAPVMVVVPERTEDGAAAAATAAVAVRLAARAGEASVLLTPPGRAGAPALALATVDHGETGRVSFAGSAPEGRAVRAYLDDRPIGVARAAAGDSWRLVPEAPVRPGRYRLRIDQIAADGEVEARIEVPFTRPTAEQPAPPEAGRRIVVEAGTNLWRIARQTYGKGLLFTTIYRANAEQIRDPDLIYPGQVFTLPRIAAR